MGPLLIRLGHEEAVRSVRAHDGAAKDYVGDHPVDVDRHPRRVGESAPELNHTRRRVRTDVGRRAHHVRQPGVGDEHDGGSPDIEHDAQGPVGQLGSSLLPAIPAVVVEVERERLEEKESDVHPHRELEDLGEIEPKSRVERDEQERQDGSPDRGGRVRHQQEPRELLGELVVLLVAAEDADGLGDHREHRHAEDERGEEEVDLGRHPDCNSTPHQGEVTVLSGGDSILRPRDVGEDLEGQAHQPQGSQEPQCRSTTSSRRLPSTHHGSFLVHRYRTRDHADPPLPRKNGSFFEKSTGRLLRTSSMTSISTLE